MSVPGAAEVQQYVEEVLKRPEFNAAPPRQGSPGWLLRALEWLAGHKVPVIGNISIGTLILLGAAAALLVFLAVRLVRSLRTGGFHLPRRPAGGGTLKGTFPDGRPFSPVQSLRLAGAALESGDTRGAIQELFRACLAHLAGLGVIVLEKWKTNLAYVRECPRQQPAFGLFKDLAQAHNDIVYAHRVLDAGRIRSLMDDLQRRIEAQ